MPVQILDMPVTQIAQETWDTRTFRLQPPAEFDSQWLPGQFITTYLPADPKTRKAYSLSNSPLDGHFLEITIKQMGDFGARFYETARVGMKLPVIPPRGKFILPDDPARPLMLISGGSGVTPYRSMMRWIVQKKLPTRVVTLYSVRTPPDIIFQREFEELCRQNPNFSFHVTCTRLPAEDDSWQGRRGRVSPAMVEELTPDRDRAVYYVCGGHEFVRDVAAMLHGMGFPKERVLFEDWG